MALIVLNHVVGRALGRGVQVIGQHIPRYQFFGDALYQAERLQRSVPPPFSL